MDEEGVEHLTLVLSELVVFNAELEVGGEITDGELAAIVASRTGLSFPWNECAARSRHCTQMRVSLVFSSGGH